jgi:hypothetical protein
MPLCHIVSIHLSVDKHLRWFHILAYNWHLKKIIQTSKREEQRKNREIPNNNYQREGLNATSSITSLLVYRLNRNCHNGLKGKKKKRIQFQEILLKSCKEAKNQKKKIIPCHKTETKQEKWIYEENSTDFHKCLFLRKQPRELFKLYASEPSAQTTEVSQPPQ